MGSCGSVDRDLVERVFQFEMTHVMWQELVAKVAHRGDDEQTKQATHVALA
jgi:hypothetical protein